jgi:hypothetical protein
MFTDNDRVCGMTRNWQSKVVGAEYLYSEQQQLRSLQAFAVGVLEDSALVFASNWVSKGHPKSREVRVLKPLNLQTMLRICKFEVRHYGFSADPFSLNQSTAFTVIKTRIWTCFH